MMKKRKQYSDEFKAEAASMVTEQGRTIGDVSASLAVGQTALRRWVESYSSGKQLKAMSHPKAAESDQLRIKELEKRVKTLEKERDILKKSISFFAREIEL